MLDGLATPFICAAKSDSFVQWFACLKKIVHHPLLNEEEKFLWLWLATQSTNNMSFYCSFSYEQISQAMNKSARSVHRNLTRLRTMGFLIANIPIYYGEPTPEMVKETRYIKLIAPPKGFFIPASSKLITRPVLKNLINTTSTNGSLS